MGTKQGRETVEEEDPGDGGHHDQPEPDQDEDLLVDDVQRQNAEAVLELHTSRRTVLVERTFGNLKEREKRLMSSPDENQVTAGRTISLSQIRMKILSLMMLSVKMQRALFPLTVTDRP